MQKRIKVDRIGILREVQLPGLWKVRKNRNQQYQE